GGPRSWAQRRTGVPTNGRRPLPAGPCRAPPSGAAHRHRAQEEASDGSRWGPSRHGGKRRLAPVAVRSDVGSVGVAELVATLSLAADLGLGQPMEHCLRQAVIALRLGESLDLDDTDRVSTYYAGLMMN